MIDKNAIRVVIQQPALPKYRVPVFRELSRRPEIRPAVYYGQIASNLPNVESSDFENHAVPMQRCYLIAAENTPAIALGRSSCKVA